MADKQTEVQVGLSLNTEGLKQGLSEAEKLMAAGVERMNGLGLGQPGGGSMPPLPPPVPQPPIPSAPQSGGNAPGPIAQVWEEIERIKSVSRAAPDVAMAMLNGGDGSGGLKSQVLKGALSAPGESESYQQLLDAIKDLTRSIKDEVKGAGGEGGDPATGLLRFLKGNALMGVAGNVAQNAMSGNLVGAGTTAIGGALGFMVGGPLGAQAGASLGGMAGGMINGVLGGAGEAQQYSMQTADIAARFGNFGQERGLKMDAIAGMKTSGYSPQETAGLFDSLRQNRLISDTGEESKELVESLQALTRATGIQTETLVNQYANYKNLGGQGTAEQYTAQVIAGAVSSGMRTNLQEYGELLGSARMQLVYQSGQGDQNDGALKALQGTMTNLLGGQSRSAELMRDNPMMAQQMMGNFLAMGGGKQYSFDSAAMQVAGIERGRTDDAYINPAQRVTNAATRMMAVVGNSLPGISSTLGMSQEEIKAAIQANPNFLEDKLSNNPNAKQAAALQDQLNMSFQGQFGRMPTAQDTTLLKQLGSQAIANDMKLDLNAPTGDGKSLSALITESQKTEGQQARDAAAEKHKELMRLMDNFKGLLTNLDKLSAEILRGVNDLVGFVKPLGALGDQLAKFINPSGAPGQNLMQAIGANPVATTAATGLLSGLPGIGPAIGTAVGLGKVITGTANAKAPTGQEFMKGALEGAKLIPGIGLGAQAIDAGGKLLHDMFNDTPPGGVMATAGYNTFRFAEGDVVHASQGGMGMGGGSSASITVNLSVPNGADYQWTRDAAREGARSGLDEFLIQREAGRLQPRNQPRISQSMY